MSDTMPDAPKPQPPAQAPEPPKPEVEETDWKAEARKWEQRAKENKTAADKLAEFEEANKSAEEKAAARLAAAEKAATEAEAKALRRDVALEHRLSKEDAALLDTITNEDAMRSLAARLAPAEDDGSPRAPRPDPNQGRPAGAPASTGDQFAGWFTTLGG